MTDFRIQDSGFSVQVENSCFQDEGLGFCLVIAFGHYIDYDGAMTQRHLSRFSFRVIGVSKVSDSK